MNRTTVPAALLAVLLASSLAACSGQSETDEALDRATSAASEAADAASQAADDVDEAVDEAVDEVSDQIPVASPAAATGESFLTEAGYATVVAEIAAAVGTPDAQLVDLTVFPDHFVFSAVDPAAPTELNEWTYVNGAVLGSAPVDYGGDVEALEANLFPAASLTPQAIGLFASEAVTLSGVEGGELQHVRVARNLPFSEDVQLTGYVTSERNSKTVTGNVEGQVLKVS